MLYYILSCILIILPYKTMIFYNLICMCCMTYIYTVYCNGMHTGQSRAKSCEATDTIH